MWTKTVSVLKAPAALLIAVGCASRQPAPASAPVFVTQEVAGVRTVRDPGTLVVAFHGDGIRFFRSDDDGEHWRAHSHLEPPSGFQYVEASLRVLPAPRAERSRLLLACGKVEPTTRTAQLELRVSTDRGRTWSQPRVMASGGTTGDGARVGLGPPRSDGTLVASYSYRATEEGPVQVRVVRVSVDSLDPVSVPITVVTVAKVTSGAGVFPLPAECPGGTIVVYSSWMWDGWGSIWTVPLTDPASEPQILAERSDVGNGYGRVWFLSDWEGQSVSLNCQDMLILP